jgi:hypothetical protein
VVGAVCPTPVGDGLLRGDHWLFDTRQVSFL